MTSNAVSVPTSAGTDLATLHPEIASLLRELSMEATNVENVDDFAMTIMTNILSAETEEDIFGAQDEGMTSGKDYLNTPFRLDMGGISWRASSEDYITEGGFPFYAIMNVTEIESGEEFALNCGGKSFVAVLRALQRREMRGDLSFEDKPFARFAADGGRPFEIHGKKSGRGTVLILRPYKIIVPAQAKKSGKTAV